MPKVFVHGNPECDVIWGPLVEALAVRGVGDCVLLSPPGFGSPVPAGFDATPGSYVEWLANELTQLGGPIDLVGHDWGAGHVLGLAAAHPELVRSYTFDCAGLLHPEMVWHDMAQVWQTEGAGEEAIAAMLDASLDDRVALFETLGVPEGIGRPMAAALDAEMGECILKLYRGAAQPYMASLGERLLAAPSRPAHIIAPTDDPYVPHHLSPVVAEQLGARHSELAGRGHWWMFSDVDEPADAIAEFWSSLD